MNLKSLNASETQQLESKLKNLLARSLHQDNMQDWADMVDRLAKELNISHLQCAAVLASSNKKLKSFKRKQDQPAKINGTDRFVDKPRMIRYRLDVGRKHNVTVEEIKKTLVEESGVDNKQMGYIHLHAVYSLIDLPEGMPSDIFQHLKTVRIKIQALQIKPIQSGARRGNTAFKKPGRRVHQVTNKTSS
jgi:hypothetical protein